MNDRKSENPNTCSGSDISFYVDGEMSLPDAAQFELHLRDCEKCRASVNEQKGFLFALSNLLENENDPKVPESFIRSVVTAAESGVSGVRRKRELVPALAVVSLLLLAVIGLLGAQSRDVLSAAGDTAGKISLLAILAARTAYNLVFGATHFIRATIIGQPLVAIMLCIAAVAIAIVVARSLSKPVSRFFKA